MGHLKDALIRKTAFDRNAAARQQMMEMQRAAQAKKAAAEKLRQQNLARMKRGQSPTGSREIKGAPIDPANVASKQPMNVSKASYNRGGYVDRDFKPRQELVQRRIPR